MLNDVKQIGFLNFFYQSMASSFTTMNSNSQKKKRNSGFLGRSKQKSKETVKNPISEKELLSKPQVTPEDVLRLSSATESNELFCFAYLGFSDLNQFSARNN